MEIEPIVDLPKPPRGVFVLNPIRPIVFEEKFGVSKSMFFKKKKYENWHEEFYALIAPKGYVMTGMELVITGRLLDQRPYYSYDLRVLPFPLPNDYIHHWTGAIFGQTVNKTTLKKPISFYGDDLKIASLFLLEGTSEIENWRVNV